jgi:UDP-N-acetylglucosamine 2-epimerase (non-hydrolysing)
MSIIGTRPEAIKMAPVIRELSQSEQFESIVCSTGQHRQMLDQVTQFFNINVDVELGIMKPGQDLFDIISGTLIKLKDTLKEIKPDYILVHGDTSSCLAGAMAGFYSGIPVGHVEAGLRTHNLQAPFPEEANRCMVSKIATHHFCPTSMAKNNLLQEAISEQAISVTGNTVIDALLWGNQLLDNRYNNTYWEKIIGHALTQRILNPNRKLILITGHRRENLGEGFNQICHAIKTLADIYPNMDFVYPVHLNPKVREPVHNALGNAENIHLIEPQEYATFIWLMNQAFIILTDSGGIQEEAPSLNKPVLVLRDVTERPEAITAGTVKLVGTDSLRIINEFRAIADSPLKYSIMAEAKNPFGDGTAAQKIIRTLLHVKQGRQG